ncbi:MAG: flagellar biosynthesis/type III secretory pathway protein FliH [Alphaproteobacteria bacterium]|jgi:flagellar biosynthesis/type III secretory pathway protein FliH
MTTSSKSFVEFLDKSDFAEMAKERKRQILIEEKKARDLQKKKDIGEAEKARIAALPKITDEDLKRAEQEGFEKGIIAGQEQASQELREEFNKHLGQMRQQIEDIPKIIKEQLALMQTSTLNLTREILKAVIAHSSEHYSEEILNHLLSEALEKSQKKAKLIINLAPSNRFYLEQQGKDTFKDLNVSLVEDESMTAGDCIISWDNSGVDARVSAIALEVDKAIDAAARGIKAQEIEFDYIKQEIQEEKAEIEANAALPVASTENEDNQMQDETETLENVEKVAETNTLEQVEQPKEIPQPTQEDTNSSEDVTNDNKKEPEIAS